jgi:hypothetical protein
MGPVGGESTDAALACADCDGEGGRGKGRVGGPRGDATTGREGVVGAGAGGKGGVIRGEGGGVHL